MLVCAVTIVVAGAGPHGAQAADPAAIEEYVLTLPGAQPAAAGQQKPLVGRSRRIGPTGVSGERKEAPTTLAAIGSAAASPAGIVVALAFGAGVTLAARGRREAS